MTNDTARIILYTQPACPACSRAKKLLSALGLAYDEIDAPHGSEVREKAFALAGGARTMPQIFINDRPIGGYRELTEIVTERRLGEYLG